MSKALIAYYYQVLFKSVEYEDQFKEFLKWCEENPPKDKEERIAREKFIKNWKNKKS